MADTPNKLALVYGDSGLGVTCGPRAYLFSYAKGGPISLRDHGKEWLYRAPQPAFWRATTDNDRGNGFPKRAIQWLGADQFIDVAAPTITVDGTTLSELPIPPVNNHQTGQENATTVTLAYLFTTLTIPQTTVTVTYTVTAPGDLAVQVHYAGGADLPELPCFGLRWVMPTEALGFDYTGLSGETYPDRMAGGVAGTYHVAGLPVTPYLVPQDCGMHMATTALTITRQRTLNNADRDAAPFTLQWAADDQPFAFSCLPYLPEELENATHHSELPPVHRTVLTIYGAVRGVGGIDSWGADVTAPYRIDGQEAIDFRFKVG